MASNKKVKNGAGYFFVSGGYGLLIKRVSKHNDKAWDLAGGNVEPTDRDLAAAALREAEEELGALPKHIKRLATVSLCRGKHGQKKYTVFVAEVPPHVRDSFEPELSEEHSDWHWFKVHGLVELHDRQVSSGIPNVPDEDAPEPSGCQKGDAASEGAADAKQEKRHRPLKHSKHRDEHESGQQYIRDNIKLHPWVFLLFDKQQRKQWLPKMSGEQESRCSKPDLAGTDPLSAEAKDWLAEAGVAAQPQHQSDEDGIGGSYVKVERPPSNKDAVNGSTSSSSYCTIS
ncbi:NUDIX hydrolase domain-like protein [Dunaliella salina]|uniref:NUDIX hydrolase domain-like protein n=1 Tax=Dunaliella salina TaxID=3046 RepID=A0ABQ7GXQ1_DUNSA|nr:NUDIX hydrolase domain-like protein [Dunaliella salina]|eukprot:KAF5839384.1 NUDIX hydrolase domain-like protein [Dunaliella salina]